MITPTDIHTLTLTHTQIHRHTHSLTDTQTDTLTHRDTQHTHTQLGWCYARAVKMWNSQRSNVVQVQDFIKILQLSDHSPLPLMYV